jgi:hypothetical protein
MRFCPSDSTRPRTARNRAIGISVEKSGGIVGHDPCLRLGFAHDDVELDPEFDFAPLVFRSSAIGASLSETVEGGCDGFPTGVSLALLPMAHHRFSVSG